MSKKVPAATAASVEKEHEDRTDVDEEEDDDDPAAVEEDKSKAEEASAMNSMNAGDDDKDDKDDVDVGSLKKLLTALKVQEEQDKEATLKREKELATVKVNKEDVALLASELLLNPAQAERKLREAHGDLHGCLKAALRLP